MYSVVPHEKGIQQTGKRLSIAGSKLLGTKNKRATQGALPLNLETMSVKGGKSGRVDEKDEKLRRGGTFRRFMKFFVSS